jgi:hypothetical protein
MIGNISWSSSTKHKGTLAEELHFGGVEEGGDRQKQGRSSSERLTTEKLP